MTGPALVVEPDTDVLARTIAARLLGELARLQDSGTTPSIVLTGGSIAGRAYREVATAAGEYAIDWSRVDIWWGDERFVPSGDADRNAGQARAAFLDRLGVDPARVHVMPADNGALGLEASAEAYAGALAEAADDRVAPRFDVLMLGVGPDGHVASLFPGRPELHEGGRTTVGVTGAPKPPPRRISMTYAALNRASKVWFLAAGEEKAEAVRCAVAGDPVERTPASGVRGTVETAWLLEQGAASALPARSDPRR